MKRPRRKHQKIKTTESTRLEVGYSPLQMSAIGRLSTEREIKVGSFEGSKEQSIESSRREKISKPLKGRAAALKLEKAKYMEEVIT